MALPKYRLPGRPHMADIDIEDYLILDKHSVEAHYEYLDGVLRMLAGGSNYHSVIIARLTSVIDGHLEDGPCWTFNSDVRLQLSESRYVHPDLTVSCDPRDQSEQDEIHFPKLVVESLSPTTEDVDKGFKIFAYQECPTIQEYMLVDSLSIRIVIYRRKDGWRLHEYGPGDTVRLESIDLEFPINRIYRGMNLTGTRKNKKKNNRQTARRRDLCNLYRSLLLVLPLI